MLRGQDGRRLESAISDADKVTKLQSICPVARCSPLEYDQSCRTCCYRAHWRCARPQTSDPLIRVAGGSVFPGRRASTELTAAVRRLGARNTDSSKANVGSLGASMLGRQVAKRRVTCVWAPRFCFLVPAIAQMCEDGVPEASVSRSTSVWGRGSAQEGRLSRTRSKILCNDDQV